MSGFAWVTLATNDSYSLGALVLAHSLRQVATGHQLAVLVTPGVSDAMKAKLASVFNVVQEVNVLDSRNEENLRLLKRPELGITFTKLHCWRLTQFQKCVFLDADTLVLQNADELFEREEFSAAPDVGWPDCFNSGVFVYRPSEETYNNIIQFAVDKGSFDGGDQGLLNLYFANWAHKDISKHLPFIYNTCSTACYSYLPAFKQFGGNVKIIHFIGNSKPWLQYFDTESRQVQTTSDLHHLHGLLQHWWNIFCSYVHPELSPEMAQGSAAHYASHHSTSRSIPFQYNPSLNYYNSNLLFTNPRSELDSENLWDPWEEYEQNTGNVPSAPVNVNITEHESSAQVEDPPESNQNCDISNVEIHFEHSSDSNVNKEIENVNEYTPESENHAPTEEQPCPDSSTQKTLLDPPVTVAYIPPECKELAWPPECEPVSCVTKETALHTPCELHDGNAGLAGAFAQLTLGAPRTAEQSLLEDHLRRQGWEVGNIDYMGRDSFDNIWTKICQTLSDTHIPPTVASSEVLPVQPQNVPDQENIVVPATSTLSEQGKGIEETAPKTEQSAVISPPALPVHPIQEIIPEPVSVLEPTIPVAPICKPAASPQETCLPDLASVAPLISPAAPPFVQEQAVPVALVAKNIEPLLTPKDIPMESPPTLQQTITSCMEHPPTPAALQEPTMQPEKQDLSSSPPQVLPIAPLQQSAPSPSIPEPAILFAPEKMDPLLAKEVAPKQLPTTPQADLPSPPTDPISKPCPDVAPPVEISAQSCPSKQATPVTSPGQLSTTPLADLPSPPTDPISKPCPDGAPPVEISAQSCKPKQATPVSSPGQLSTTPLADLPSPPTDPISKPCPDVAPPVEISAQSCKPKQASLVTSPEQPSTSPQADLPSPPTDPISKPCPDVAPPVEISTQSSCKPEGEASTLQDKQIASPIIEEKSPNVPAVSKIQSEAPPSGKAKHTPPSSPSPKTAAAPPKQKSATKPDESAKTPGKSQQKTSAKETKAETVPTVGAKAPETAVPEETSAAQPSPTPPPRKSAGSGTSSKKTGKGKK